MRSLPDLSFIEQLLVNRPAPLCPKPLPHSPTTSRPGRQALLANPGPRAEEPSQGGLNASPQRYIFSHHRAGLSFLPPAPDQLPDLPLAPRRHQEASRSSSTSIPTCQPPPGSASPTPAGQRLNQICIIASAKNPPL